MNLWILNKSHKIKNLKNLALVRFVHHSDKMSPVCEPKELFCFVCLKKKPFFVSYSFTVKSKLSLWIFNLLLTTNTHTQKLHADH